LSGICGIVDFDGAPVDPDLLRKLAQAAAHRGPDGIRCWTDGNVGLGHLALYATSEAERERQPLVSVDGRVRLVADARIDNRPELIRTLTAKGYLEEKDPTDADLILAAYECWGERSPEFLIGDFAFAIWDGRKRSLFCARDALGIKPLHYGRAGRVLCVASEAQQILQHPAIPRRLDEVAMADHLVNNCDDEERTIFLDVRRLPPAHRLIATQSGMRLERYWDIDPSAGLRYATDEEYADHFLDLFRRAVDDRLRTQAGVIAIAMSGGLDSCSIAAVAPELLAKRNGSPRLMAYSFAYELLSECDERLYSEAMADELGLEIEYIDAESFWELDDAVAFRPSLETPVMVSESLWRHLLGRARDCGARVLLTGNGGDNLLGGSPLIYADQLSRGQLSVLWGFAQRARERGVPNRRLLSGYYSWFFGPLLPGSIVQFLRRLRDGRTHRRIPPWIAPDFADRTDLARRLSRAPVPRRFRSLARQEIYEFCVSLGSVGRANYWFDRAVPQFGLEARHPHLDRRLVEYILSIPPEQTFQDGTTKRVLRGAMKGILPESVRLRRDKAVSNSYIDRNLREKAARPISRLLEAPMLAQLGVVDERALREAYDAYRAGKTDDTFAPLWLAVTLELWLREHHLVVGERLE